MDRETLERLLDDLETDRVERTVSLRDRDKFNEAICAFANDLAGNRKPGYLFIGAEQSGKSSGAVIDDQLLLDLAAIRDSGNIQPIPAMNVQKWNIAGGEMAVIEVFPADLPPVRYKGRVYVRIGPRRGIASEQEERILTERRAVQARTWDARPCVGATVDDLSLEAFRLTYLRFAVSPEVLEENHREIRQQLASLRLYDLQSDSPTNAGIVLLAVNPLLFVPGVYVQYVQYRGSSAADEVLRERRLSGGLLQIMRGLDELAEDVADARPVADGPRDRTVYNYPPRALHELFMNAVIHRNYDGSTSPVMISHFSDRIEIWSPGGLYGDLTREQFPRGTSYRNPILAEAAKTLGFVNRFGRGIALAQTQLRDNLSPELQFEIETNHLLVTVGSRK